MNQNYESPNTRQLRHMKQILSLEGSLLTKEQKADILRVTKQTSIIDGFDRIDYWKQWNKQSHNVPPASPKY
jgi:hypothetical protein